MSAVGEELFPTEVKDTKVESPQLSPGKAKKSHHHQHESQQVQDSDSKSSLPPLKSSPQETISPKVDENEEIRFEGELGEKVENLCDALIGEPGSRPATDPSSNPATRPSQSKSRASSTKSSQRQSPPPKKRLTYYQEMNKIPKNILYNPHVTKRLNIFPPNNSKPPACAQSPLQYRARDIQQLDEYAQQRFDGNHTPGEADVPTLRKAADQLRQLEKDLVDRSSYPEAQKAANAYLSVMEELKFSTDYQVAADNLTDMLSKRNELTSLAQLIREDWDEQIRQHDEEVHNRVEKMKQENEEELSQFEQNKPVELPPLFNKQSKTYFALRSSEKNSANCRDFEKAQKLKEKADKLQQEEMERNMTTMDSYYRTKKRRLIQAQKRATANYLTYMASKRLEKIAMRDKQVRGIEGRAASLDNQIAKMCEKKGIRQKDLNLDVIDEERVQRLREVERTSITPYRKAGPQSSLSQRSQQNDNEEQADDEGEEASQPQDGEEHWTNELEEVADQAELERAAREEEEVPANVA